MTTGFGPYETPDPDDTDADPTVLETTITASHQMVDIGGGVMAHAETYDGAIPGPTLRFNVGDTAIVRLVNDLDHPTGIHWHGVELENCADGTEVTQDPAPVGPFIPPSPLSPTGGTHLYKFKVPRPGIYWYHPHHAHSTNRVFRGLYGMIVATDPNEAALIADGTLPDAAQTLDVVLSDATVCKAPGMNDPATYADPLLLPLADRPEWLSGATSQPGPTPLQLCELDPPGQAINEDGSPAAASFAAGEIPNTQKTMLTPAGFGDRTNEGQTVLTNGMNVGGRLGTPAAPGAVDPVAFTHDVQPGQGLRLRIVNCATTRYFRLRLTGAAGALVRLARIGGEGGLLDNAIYEGGNAVGPDNFDTQYEEGEILLPPASRADVVAAIPDDAAGVLTLWTRDYSRTGLGFTNLPTVPVAHFNVAGPVVVPAYTIDGGVDGVGGTPLRAAFPGQEVETLPAATGMLLDPAAFAPAKLGMADQDIELSVLGGGMTGINGVAGSFEGFTPYTSIPHIGSSRYAEPGEVLELTVTNPSSAHHPFHLHGFSFQPISYTRMGGPNYDWPYREFRDNLDIPAGYTLTFRVRLDDRELADGVTLGGAFGRWLFHCHIFFHAHMGMISELVATAADGSEKPNVDVNGSWAYTASGGTATRTGTFFHPDGKLITLTESDGVLTSPGAPAASGSWTWELDSSIGPEPDGVRYVYITATDTDGRQDQAVFRLKIGAPDDGSDNGDPHIHTVDGQRYDFQAVGEFTLLRDRDGMEVQTRQWPVKTATPITDPHSGLTSCVSLNVAAAVRVGAHRIAYQPGREGDRLEFFLDGKRAQLPTGGLDLGAHRVTAIAVAGGMQLRVDYAHGPVVTITPHFWNAYNIAYLNVSIAHTQGGEGLMGRIPAQSWLPALPSGATVGPLPASLPDRYVALYRTFANAWRVTGQTSLFVYAPGTSTATFTDVDWPAEKPPCKLKPQFEIPGAQPPTVGIPIEEAEQICKAVTDDGLHRDCVFDVATTGDKTFADAYLAAQDLKLCGCAVQIVGASALPRYGAPLVVTVTVTPLSCDRPTPTGSVRLVVDGAERGRPRKLDRRGRVVFKIGRLKTGVHAIRAAYSGSRGKSGYHPCSSPNLLCTVGRPRLGRGEAPVPGHGEGPVHA
jgi:FtsP/CotA-like multicopper oxidase with cupredoxin domain